MRIHRPAVKDKRWSTRLGRRKPPDAAWNCTGGGGPARAAKATPSRSEAPSRWRRKIGAVRVVARSWLTVEYNNRTDRYHERPDWRGFPDWISFCRKLD